MSEYSELDLELTHGRVHAQRWGAAGAPLVLCVHGLSANMHAFDFLAGQIMGPHRQVVAIDLRGRGRSEITPPGSYGLASHAEDVLEIAAQLGAERFDYIGWSLGALIGITVAGRAAERLRTLTLIDHANREQDVVNAAVRIGVNRLDAVVDRPEDYVAAVRAAGAISPWNEHWDRIYGYELLPAGSRFVPSTSKAAALEDLDHPDRDHVVASWPKITMPALLVRATVGLGGGDTIPERDRDALLRAAPSVRLLELDANHFTVMTDERLPGAVAELLAAGS